MYQNPITLGRLSSILIKRGVVTREMIYARTRELAAIGNRAPHNVRQSDYEKAKRELTGESDAGKQEAVLLDNLPERGQSSAARITSVQASAAERSRGRP